MWTYFENCSNSTVDLFIQLTLTERLPLYKWDMSSKGEYGLQFDYITLPPHPPPFIPSVEQQLQK